MSADIRPRRRPLRLVAGIALVLLVLVLVLVALFPTLAGLGPGRKMVASTIGAAIDADVTIDRLSLAWFGEQSIGGLRAHGSDGTPVLDLDASIDRSLIALLRGRWSDATVTVDGLVHLRRNADGTVGVASAPSTTSGGAMAPVPATTTTSPDEPFRFPMPLDMTLRVGALDLRYTCAVQGVDVRLPDLALNAQLRGAAPIVATLRSAIESDGQRGLLSGDLTVDRAIAADGSLALADAQIDAELVVDRARMRYGDDLVEIDRLRFAGSTTDLAQGLDATLTVVGRTGGASGGGGAAPISIDSDLRMRLAMPDGDWLRTDFTIGGTLDAVLAAAVVGAITETASPSTRATPTATPTRSDATASPPASSASTALLPEGLDATIRIDDLALTLSDESSGRRVTAQNLVGAAMIGTVRPMRLTLRGSTEFEEPGADGAGVTTRAGQFDIDGTATNLVDSTGFLRLQDAALTLIATVDSLLLPVPDGVVEITRLSARIESERLTDAVHVAIAGQGTLDGSTQSRLNVDLHADAPVSPSGEVTLHPDRLRGDVSAENLPLALLDPFMADLPINAARDLGTRADATIRLPGGGDTAEARIVTERLTATATGRTSLEGALQIDEIAFDWRMPPALLAEFGIAVAEETSVIARGTALRIPLVDDAPDIAGLSGNVSLALAAPLRLLDEADGELTTIDSLRIGLATEAVRAGVDLAIDGALEDGTLTVRQRLTELVDDVGAISAERAVATGEIRLDGVGRDLLLAMLPDGSRALAAAVLNSAPNVIVQTGGNADRRTASVSAALGRATLATELALTSDTLHVDATTVTLVADDAILAALFEDGELNSDRPRLVGTAPIALTLSPLAIPTAILTDTERLMREGPAAEVRLAAERIAIRQATSPETVGVHDLTATVRATPGAATGLALVASTTLRSGDAPAGTISIQGDAQWRDGSFSTPIGRLEASQVQVAALERIAGVAPETWSNWLGATGALVAEATTAQGDARAGEIDVVVRPTFPQLGGELRASVNDEAIVIPQGTLTLTLPKTQVDRLLGPAEGAPAPEGPVLRAAGEMKSQLRLTDIVVDRGLFSEDGPIDPARTRGNVRFDIEPLTLMLGAERIEVRDLQVTLATDALADGIRLNAIAGRPGQPADGDVRDAVLALTSTLRTITDARGRIDTETVAVDADLVAESIPTALVDRIAAMNGRLVAALGPTMSANVRTQALSRTAGTLAGKLTSENGFLDIPRVLSRDGALRIDASMPVVAELALTPPLRRELLHGINPLLADLRTVDQPIRAVVSSAVLPLDGNLRGLNAAVRMTIGRMELDSGSAIVTVLDLTGIQQGRNLAGLIDPFNLKVVNGNLTYDDLALKLGLQDGDYRFALLFTGDVDLGSDPPLARAITTRLPAEMLSRNIRSVPTAVGRLHADIVFSGPLYAADGEPRQLNRDIKFGGDVGGIIEDVIGDIFRRRRN